MKQENLLFDVMKLNENPTSGFVSDEDQRLYEAVLRNFRGTPLYDDFRREQTEIFRHKWLESEKAGKDIGFGEALTSWITQHRNDWVSGGRELGSRAN